MMIKSPYAIGCRCEIPKDLTVALPGINGSGSLDRVALFDTVQIPRLP